MLKDAASEAQYGEKGRDGVIIVTTKEGGADSQMQTFTYGGNSSSTAVVVRGAGTEPDSLAGRVRTMTYRIDGRRDSLGGDMVWKINGRDVDAGDLEELPETSGRSALPRTPPCRGKIPLLRRG